MYTLISCLIGSCVFFYLWEVASTCFLLASFLSLGLLCQNFSVNQDMIFWGNYLSNLLIFLSVVLCFLCLITTPYEKSGTYVINLFMLSIFLSLSFSMSNMILFYVFFEASLIPTLLLIIGWGYQPERLQAGTYMMLYTVGASLPLFILLIWRCMSSGTMDMCIQSSLPVSLPLILVIFLYGAFLVKLPMYSVHLWLPKAHVEAPLVGSMILAGILLKLGGYGIFLMNKSFSMTPSIVGLVVVGVSIWGGLLVSFMCLRQVDIKALVAYSSVSHMGIVSSGLILNNTWGVTSAVITMLAHGFSSSALFCLAYFSYSKSHTRNIPYMKGLLQLYPILSLRWFIFCCINMAAPPTLNLVGELFISVALWKISWPIAVVMGLMVFLSAAYNMYLYTSINHGFHSNYLSGGSPLLSYENLSLVLHLMPLLFLIKGSLLL
uniref:NADH-ubiquinone oxidoreductase chain 4 n=1 Tax=Bullacta caurina TaxID=2510888 RepID=A0A4D6BJR2_9GAST|nr:NADH dehydrogenase subunit 4 [Bullacta caurina]QBX88150.1 NADH dehydrogenase subunit 4 [Bullacta caurina]